MLSCKDTSVMISRSLDRKLTLQERIGVKIHLMVCSACRRMVKQFELIRDISRQYCATEDSGTETRQLSGEAVSRIRERLERERKDSPEQG